MVRRGRRGRRSGGWIVRGSTRARDGGEDIELRGKAGSSWEFVSRLA